VLRERYSGRDENREIMRTGIATEGDGGASVPGDQADKFSSCPGK